MACVTGEGSWMVTTPMLPMTVRGGGDVTAAVFLAHLLTDGPQAALARTAATMYAVLDEPTPPDRRRCCSSRSRTRSRALTRFLKSLRPVDRWVLMRVIVATRRSA